MTYHRSTLISCTGEFYPSRRIVVAKDAIPYYQAARFKNKKAAGAVYIVVQELIYQDIDCDLSAYRIKLNNVWHVIVIGEKPSDAITNVV